jgi:hypothetical protein
LPTTITYLRNTMEIKNLPVSVELDHEAMIAVRGGNSDQAIGTAQQNAQGMAALANVGNGSLVLGPATIQSDNTFTQYADNDNDAKNIDLAVLFGLGLRK